SFDILPGEMLALVGESGSGKTATGRAILGLLPPGLKRLAGSITIDGEDLTTVTPARLRELRGGSIGMVFQEPMVSLNPALSIG
ncbi:ATP-binding cassette domain-containing protein, partial [Stenotrophomonas maltophilia]|uniref:ATP-binding cassette domain-containing protein n=1 Tax=Stenotrophomonas maltophilia TaxID=40324 RepID=UPI0013DA3218